MRGSGDLIAASLQVERARVLISGPGSATIGGTADQLEAVVRGSGSLQGKRLVAAHADVQASGPGDAVIMRAIFRPPTTVMDSISAKTTVKCAAYQLRCKSRIAQQGGGQRSNTS
jgi:hypothetical protein